MAVYTIADLHLSTHGETNKSMEVFGGRWTDYNEKLTKNWKHLVTDNDTVILPGDISWALTLDEAREDLVFLNSLPGRKIVGKGNHDFWWVTMKKLTEFLLKEKIGSVSFLYNNAYSVEDFIIAGTRGWYYDDATAAPDNVDFKKNVARESGRLRTSLNEAKRLRSDFPDKEIIVFMHFPPVWGERAVDEFVDILVEYGIKRLYFGHIHGVYSQPAEFTYRGIRMSIISADYLHFTPKHIPKSSAL